MWQPGPAWNDEAALAQAWQQARPFPHLIVDDFVAADALPGLLDILEDEPVDPYEGDLFAFEATAPQPRTAAFVALRDGFAAALAPRLTRITGHAVARVDMRAYAYRVGHYLLPHADHQDGLGRVLAYAYYLPSPAPPTGGALELFDCTVEDGAIVATTSAGVIAPRANRLVVFAVDHRSLHQVQEVVAGLRISLAGWFYP